MESVDRERPMAQERSLFPESSGDLPLFFPSRPFSYYRRILFSRRVIRPGKERFPLVVVEKDFRFYFFSSVSLDFFDSPNEDKVR